MKTKVDKTPTFKEALRNLRAPFKESAALWENARFILADVPLNPKAVKPILPMGMKLTRQTTGTVFIVDYKKTAFTVPYKEAIADLGKLFEGVIVEKQCDKCPDKYYLRYDRDIYAREIMEIHEKSLHLCEGCYIKEGRKRGLWQ